jgi:hypothetical protein
VMYMHVMGSSARSRPCSSCTSSRRAMRSLSRAASAPLSTRWARQE